MKVYFFPLPSFVCRLLTGGGKKQYIGGRKAAGINGRVL